MPKEIPARITYAQKKLLDLVQSRKLRKWCEDNNLSHSYLYRMSFGDVNPSYKIIASMAHLIAPIEWLYFTDEKLPFEPICVPAWNSDNPPKFVKEHKADYTTIAKIYGISEKAAHNVFVTNISYPLLPMMRKASDNGINPIEFFTDSDIEVAEKYIPGRGDIVSLNENLILVLSKTEWNEKNFSITGCCINKKENEFPLENLITKGYADVSTINTFYFNRRSVFSRIEVVSEDFLSRVLSAVKQIFE